MTQAPAPISGHSAQRPPDREARDLLKDDVIVVPGRGKIVQVITAKTPTGCNTDIGWKRVWFVPGQPDEFGSSSVPPGTMVEIIVPAALAAQADETPRRCAA